MATHLMVDLETMDTGPQATVLTLGAVKFNPFGNGYSDKLYLRIDIDDQDALGRKISQDTLDWWARQDQEVMEEAFNPHDRVPLVTAIDQFHKFAWGCDAFWSHGSIFDLMIIQDIYTQLNKSYPWNFWQIRDTRTLFDLGYDPEMPTNSKHDALQDAIRQSVGVQNIYAKLKIKER